MVIYYVHNLVCMHMFYIECPELQFSEVTQSALFSLYIIR